MSLQLCRHLRNCKLDLIFVSSCKAVALMTDKSIGDDEANALVNPPRRKGYELPAVS
jgi:hypothetical protein